MPTSLLASDRCRRWLGQFDIEDRSVARSLISALQLVSRNDVSRELSKLIAPMCKQRVAAYAIREVLPPDEYFPDRRERPVPVNDKRVGSEGTIAHLISNWADQGLVLNHPALATLRRLRIHDVLLVDDVVGSGARARQFLMALNAHPTIRSWRSFGILRLNVVAYAATADGEYVAKQALHSRRSRPFGKGVSVHYVTRPSFVHSGKLLEDDEAFDGLARKYGHRHRLQSRFWRGFGAAMTGLVFEHKCPNTTPGILWHTTTTWTPLFPGGAVPPELQGHFDRTAAAGLQQTAAAHYFFKTELPVLRGLTHDAGLSVLLLLAALSRTRRRQALVHLLGLTVQEINEARDLALRAKFIDDAGVLTDAGSAELEHAQSVGPLRGNDLNPPDGAFYFPNRRARVSS